jgi:glycosyltransferase involved in cell wall biosynthesis
MFVRNTFPPDGRVLKQALTLRDAGYHVRVVALHGVGLPDEELREGIRVNRVYHSHGPRVTRSLLRAAGVKRAGRITDWDIRLPSHADGDKTGSDGLWRHGGHSRHPVERLRRTLRRLHRRASHFGYRRRAIAAGRAERADIWVAHDLEALPIAVALARRGGRVVYDAHELYAESLGSPPMTARERRRWRRLEARKIRRTDACTTVCPSIARELADRHRIEPPTVLLNAPPYRAPERRSPSLQDVTGIPAEMPIALYAGGIQFSRPLDKLVEAAALLDNCAVVIMGPAIRTAFDSLRAQIAELGLCGRVFLVPPVPEDELVTMAATANVGVIPLEDVCLNHRYSLPNKLFQYLMAGLPIAAVGHPEIQRVIDEYGVGVTFPEPTPHSIAAAVEALLAASTERELMRERALHAATELCWEREGQKLVELVDGLVHRRTRLPEPLPARAVG